MAQVRRIVTGHDAEGQAVFLIDEAVEEEFLGAQVWSTSQLPADNSGEPDATLRQEGIAAPNGTVIRVLTIAPGHRSPMHRTQTFSQAWMVPRCTTTSPARAVRVAPASSSSWISPSRTTP